MSIDIASKASAARADRSVRAPSTSVPPAPMRAIRREGKHHADTQAFAATMLHADCSGT